MLAEHEKQERRNLFCCSSCKQSEILACNCLTDTDKFVTVGKISCSKKVRPVIPLRSNKIKKQQGMNCFS